MPMETGAVIREARASSGLSQAELATRAGTSQTALSAYESGRREPSVRTLERLLHAAGRRLAVVSAESPAREPSRRELARVDRTLRQVLELAAALPVRHERELRYPRLPS
jgi:hypothetical protein